MENLKKSIKTRPINIILVVVILLLYFFNTYFLKELFTGYVRLFFVSYFNDLMCPLFFFGYSNLLLLTVGRELRKLHHIMAVSACTSIFWEMCGPIINPDSVGDPLDVVCYLTGSVIYWLILLFIFDSDK